VPYKIEDACRIKILRRAVRQRAWIGKDQTLIKIRDMSDHHLLKAYKNGLLWYRQVQKNGDEALKTIFDTWDQLGPSPEVEEMDFLEPSECCFEQEADYVLSVMETARQYVLALQKEIKKRELQAAVKQMFKPFGSGKRGWNANNRTTAS